MFTPLPQATTLPRAAAPHCSSACCSARLRVPTSAPCAVAPVFRPALPRRRRRPLASPSLAAASADGRAHAQHGVLDGASLHAAQQSGGSGGARLRPGAQARPGLRASTD